MNMSQRVHYSFLSLLLCTSCMKESSKAEVGLVVVDRASHDFGSVLEGEMLQYEFQLRNTTASRLTVTEVLPSCGCTSFSLSRWEIEPGQTTDLSVDVATEGRPGSLSATVHVITDGGTDSSLCTLSVRAQVSACSFMYAIPPAIQVGSVRAGAPWSADVLVTYATRTPPRDGVKLRGADVSEAETSVLVGAPLPELSADPDGLLLSRFPVKVSGVAHEVEGPRAIRFVASDGTVDRELLVELQCAVVQPLATEPEALFFGSASAGERRSRQFVVTQWGEATDGWNATTSDSSMVVSNEGRGSGTIVVVFPPTPGPFAGEATVEHEGLSVKIAVAGIVRE